MRLGQQCTRLHQARFDGQPLPRPVDESRVLDVVEVPFGDADQVPGLPAVAHLGIIEAAQVVEQGYLIQPDRDRFQAGADDLISELHTG